MKKLIFLLSAIIVFSSCSVKLVPAKSQEAIDLLNQIQTDANAAFSDLNFNQVEYDKADAEIGALKVLDLTRDHAGKLVTQDEKIQNLFTEYETEHRSKGTIVASESNVYSSYFKSVLRPRIISENSLK